MPRRLLIFLLLALTAALAQTPAGKRPFTFEDMMQLKRVSDPQISPDGRWVLFNVVDVNLEANTKTPHLWLVPLDGSAPSRQLTTGKDEDRGRWSPDGKSFLYITDADGSSQVWIQGFDSATGQLAGEPRKVTNISTEAGGAMWSPDGKSILFTSAVYPDCKDDACNKEKDDAAAKSKVKAQIWTELFYRHWKAYRGPKRSHLFLVSAEGGVARDLTPGTHDVPPFKLGGGDLHDFSPDSKEICFTSNVDEVEATSTNDDLFLVPADGSAAPKKITTNPASDSTPRYSPDGKSIAFLMQKVAGFESDRFRLALYDRASGKVSVLSESFDRWVGSFTWAPDSQSIYFSADDKGSAPLYRLIVPHSADYTRGSHNESFDVAASVREILRGSNDEPNVTRDGKTLVYMSVSAQWPMEVFRAPADPAPMACRVSNADEGNANCFPTGEPLSKVNDALLSQISMSPVEPFWFTGSENAKVEGFLVKPPNFDAHKKYPVKFLVHGGPQGAWGDEWSYRWNAELFAANGYVVIMVNPRGSTGYGQQFINDVSGDWGGRAYQDLMLGLDYAERTYPFVDKERECVLGASYGGYMTNWIIGHTTRFKCAVSHDGVFDTESAYGTTEELWFPEWEFRGTPWTNRALYRKWSPMLAAPNFHTPTLVVHGQLDFRLDVSQGFELFTTLQRLHVPSKMLYFPDEGHWVLKPQNSRLWYKTVNDWVDQWAGQSASK